MWLKMRKSGNSLAIQWLRFSAFTAVALGSISGWGAKIPQAVWPKDKWEKALCIYFNISHFWSRLLYIYWNFVWYHSPSAYTAWVLIMWFVHKVTQLLAFNCFYNIFTEWTIFLSLSNTSLQCLLACISFDERSAVMTKFAPLHAIWFSFALTFLIF